LLERHGRVTTLRVSTGLAIVGLALFTLAPSLPFAMAGVALWGLGAALGFPVGMSAASDEPARAAARISVVSTIGYTAFMAGPPLIGLLAEVFGYRGALLFVALPLVVAFLLIPATRPLTAQRPGAASSLPA
ncbi:MAG: MFS transporter, partial [Actinomycetes bacterium]|nr:MFS transporter [Actinomycetes bacterium]